MSNVKNMENKEKMDNIAAELQSLFTEFESLYMNTLEKAKKKTGPSAKANDPVK